MKQMNTTIAYESLLVFSLLILNALYQKYVANITIKQFTKSCFTLWFYNFIKKNGQRKEEDDTFLRKKSDEKQNIATIMISVDGKGAVFPVKLKLKVNRLNKDIKIETFLEN